MNSEQLDNMAENHYQVYLSCADNWSWIGSVIYRAGASLLASLERIEERLENIDKGIGP